MIFRQLTGFRTFSRTHGGLSETMVGTPKNTHPREISPYVSTKILLTISAFKPNQLFFFFLQRRGGHVGDDHEVIVTLDPHKFAKKKQQRISIGNQQNFSARITLRNQLTCGIVPCISYDRSHRTETQTHWPYPPDTNGFLYYTTPPDRPRIAGELRFRVTSSDDPASFANGSDLLRMNGQLWSRPLYVISKLYTPLYQKLREDRLVPDDLDNILSSFPQKNVIYSRSQLLYTLNDTFIIDFSYAGQYFSVITEKGVETLPFRARFFDNRDSCRGTPYRGAYYTSSSFRYPLNLIDSSASIGNALARFERSTLPDHAGTRTIVLRFLKMITPVKCVMPLYDGYIACPKEGELYQRIPYPIKASIKSYQQVWSANIDKPKGLMLRGLQLLWDA